MNETKPKAKTPEDVGSLAGSVGLADVEIVVEPAPEGSPQLPESPELASEDKTDVDQTIDAQAASAPNNSADEKERASEDTATVVKPTSSRRKRKYFPTLAARKVAIQGGEKSAETSQPIVAKAGNAASVESTDSADIALHGAESPAGEAAAKASESGEVIPETLTVTEISADSQPEVAKSADAPADLPRADDTQDTGTTADGEDTQNSSAEPQTETDDGTANPDAENISGEGSASSVDTQSSSTEPQTETDDDAANPDAENISGEGSASGVDAQSSGAEPQAEADDNAAEPDAETKTESTEEQNSPAVDSADAGGETVTVFGEGEVSPQQSEKKGDVPSAVRSIFTREEQAEISAIKIASSREEKKRRYNPAFKVAVVAVAILLVAFLAFAVVTVAVTAFSDASICSMAGPGGISHLFFGKTDRDGNPVSGKLYLSLLGGISLSEDGVLTYSSGDIYTGARNGFVRDGYGKLECASGDSYEGYFSDDLFNGTGTYTYSSGDEYEGSFVSGKMDGYGTYTYANGDSYTGSFKNGFIDGSGTYTSPCGDKYVGEFANGIISGSGVYVWADGTTYTGTFSSGVPDGAGSALYPCGDSYVGSFVNGVREGSGIYTYADGSVYTGTFESGEPSGTGTLTLANGDRYVGEFAYGVINGHGTYTWASTGRTYTGNFKNGEIAD